MANETERIENMCAPTHEDDAYLTVRAYNMLKRESIHTVPDLEKLCPCKVRDIRNLGVATLRNIEAALKAYNGHDLAPCLHWGDCPVCNITITRGMVEAGLIRMSTWDHPREWGYAHTACLKEWERTRLAALYVIGDQIDMLNAENFAHEAKEWGVPLESLGKELQRQADLMMREGLKGRYS